MADRQLLRQAVGGRVKGQHFVALDGLRGVAALAVVIYHRRWLGPHGHAFDHGFLAVSFFFILSGFVIDHAYRDRLAEGMTLRRFLIFRAIRLYPLIAMGALLGAAILLLLTRSVPGEYSPILVALPFTALALPAPKGLLSEPFRLNPPTWSLFNELIANVVFAFVLHRLGVRALTFVAALAGAAFITMALQLGTINSGYRYGEIANGLIVTAAPFTIGMLLNRIRSRLAGLPAIPFWLAALLLTATFMVPDLPPSLEAPYQLALALLFYPALILATQASEPTAKWVPIAAASGYISFPVYALHYPLLGLFDRAMAKLGGPAELWLCLMLLGCTIAACAAGKYMEEPVRRWLSSRLTTFRRTKVNGILR